MFSAEITSGQGVAENVAERGCEVAVLWIDWYAYHIGRFRGLSESPKLGGRVAGIEMVGGVGVHAGLKFREKIPDSLTVETLFPGSSWAEAKGWTGARAVWRCLNKLNPSVVLVPGYYTLPGLSAAFWCKWHRRRAVLMTESTAEDHRRLPWQEAAKSLLIRGLFDFAITGGAPQRRYLEQLKFPAARIARFYDVVDNEFFARQSSLIRRQCCAAEFGLPDEYFLYVGRLSPEKNIAGLIEAYAEYRHGGGSQALVLVGDGPQRAELEAMATQTGFAADIRFEGLQGTADLPRYYGFATCFVLPSTREPWGLVANEAMASGLPVVISRRCGCAEDLVVEGKNGLLFDPEEAGALSVSLSVMGSLGRARLAEMGAASAEIIAGYSPRAWAAEVARLVRA
jgi:1,2-diacylglycerol 3-alpha-glucosyltransferase